MATGRIPINGTAAIQQTLIDAKGDLIAGTGADAVSRLAVGANGTTLVADSAEATGLKWATASSGGMTLINTGGTTLTGASVTIGSIPSGYINLQLIVTNYLPATDNNTLSVRINNDSNANRHKLCTAITQENVSFDDTVWNLTGGGDNAVSETIIKLDIYGYANTTTWKMGQSNFLQNYHGSSSNMNIGIRQFGYNQTGAITSLVLFPGSGNFTSGTAYLYGVK